MIPLVLNDDLTRLIQINMATSIGQEGKNLVAVDGRVGPLTIGAITRFQRAAKRRVADGRIDPAGSTLNAPGQLLNPRGLLPRNIEGLGPPDEKVRRGIVGVPSPSPNCRSLVGNGIPFVSTADWKFASSAGAGITGFFGQTGPSLT